VGGVQVEPPQSPQATRRNELDADERWARIIGVEGVFSRLHRRWFLMFIFSARQQTIEAIDCTQGRMARRNTVGPATREREARLMYGRPVACRR
jgi:hypothetical protein